MLFQCFENLFAVQITQDTDGSAIIRKKVKHDTDKIIGKKNSFTRKMPER